MEARFDGIAEFVAVSRLGSFTAAAAELGLTKSAVARAVSRLEARLSNTLMHRTTRRLTLTPAGEAWLEHCAAALDALGRGESALALARDMPSGEVRIDLPTAYGRLHVMPVLVELARRYPALGLNVSFTDRRVDLIGETIDVAVRIGVLEDSTELLARQIGIQHMVIVAAPGYLATRGVPRSADDLADHDCVAGRRQGSRIAWLMKKPDGISVWHKVPVKHELQDFEMVLMAVRAGLGLTQLPLWLVQDDVRRGTLEVVLDGLSGGEWPIHLLWPRTRTLPAKVRVIVDGLVEWANGLPPPVA